MIVDAANSADSIIRALALQPHPEGGHYREWYRDGDVDGRRGAATSIFYLLAAGEVSHWHRVDAVELWHFHGGAPLRLSLSADGDETETVELGVDMRAGQQLATVVPAGAWQSARSAGAWSLVGCTVAPAFSFSGFEMAPPGWAPSAADAAP